MSQKAVRHLRANCSAEGANSNIPFDVGEVSESFQKEFEIQLKKKGIALTWVSAGESPDIQIWFVEVDQGSQLLRYLIPMAAPARVEIEGRKISKQGQPVSFKRIKRAHTGLLGGSPKRMISACVTGLAKKVAKEID